MAHGLVRRESVASEMHKSTDKKNTFVFTKKRGYDVTRNPHLNKVSGVSIGTLVSVCSGEMLDKLAGAFMERRKRHHCKHLNWSFEWKGSLTTDYDDCEHLRINLRLCFFALITFVSFHFFQMNQKKLCFAEGPRIILLLKVSSFLFFFKIILISILPFG